MVNISRRKEPKSLTQFKKSYKRLQGLQHITSKLSGALTKQQVARIILHEGLSVLKANTGEVDILQADLKDSFEVLALKGYSKDFFDYIAMCKSPLLTDMAIKSKKPVFIDHVDDLDESYSIAKLFIKHVGATSAAILPLVSNNEVIGILQFTFEKNIALDNEDKKFMMILAGQCAQAFERVTAQENLKSSKEQLEIILNNISDIIITHDRSGKIIFSNNKGIQREQDKNKLISMKELVDYYTQQFTLLDETGKRFDFEKFISKQFISKEKKTAVVQMIDKKTNETFWQLISPSFIYDTHPAQIVIVVHDITKEKDIEKRKDDFISMASHELKTPLTTLKVFTQTLKKYFADEKSIKLLDRMDDQVSRLTSIVTELLDITKIKQGKLNTYTSKFNISELIKEVTDDMQSITHHKLGLQIPPEIYVVADKDRISQVVTNFISNAIKYSPKEEKIDILATVRNNQFLFSVKDYGIGISKDNQDKIFERFYRAEDEQKTYPGLGLGLYISSEIVKQHKGSIWVDSEIGKGSTFSFSIPLS